MLGINVSKGIFNDKTAMIKSFIFFLFLGPMYVSFSGAFIYQHRSNMKNAYTTVAIFFASIGCSSQYLFLKFMEEKIEKLIDDFQNMIDKGSGSGLQFCA